MKIFYQILAGLILITIPLIVHAETINVEVENIMVSRGGNVMVLLFTGEGFPIKHDKALTVKTKPASAERLKFLFKKTPSKHVAFKVLHDEDANKKVSKNWTGIWPKEGLGFSNGRQMSAIGPPNFEEAKLVVADITDSVTLIVTYP